MAFETLDLSENLIGPDGARSLASAFKKNSSWSLKSLNLSSNMYNGRSVRKDIFVLIFRYLAMVFFLDDDLEQDERLLDRVYDELKTWEEFENLEAKHPYSRFYISYVFIPLSGLTASDHLNRLVREHLRYMEGVKESLTVNRETGLDDYLQIRSKDIGVSQWRPFLLMIAEMPKDTPDPILEDISKNIILFVLLQNDVYSFEKEWKILPTFLC